MKSMGWKVKWMGESGVEDPVGGFACGDAARVARKKNRARTVSFIPCSW